jgi:hypothetical protein
MYVEPNFKTKKALKEAVTAGEYVTVFQPNDMFGSNPPTDGFATVEGPHYPKPHKWYAEVGLVNGVVATVK